MRAPLFVCLLLGMALCVCQLHNASAHTASEWTKSVTGVWHHVSDGAPSRDADTAATPTRRGSRGDAMAAVAGAAAVTLTASPSILQKNGDTVTITWMGVPNPTEKDWIAVYAPVESENHLYLDYQYVANSNTSQLGYGQLSFQLLNIRKNYIFKYFANNGYTLVAESSPVSFASFSEPVQGRLAYPGRPDQMRVMWTSNTTAAPTVLFGFGPDQLTLTAVGSSSTYKASDMCGAPANLPSPISYIDPGFIHDVLLTNLKPATLYFYRYGNADFGWSAVFNFTSAPLPGHNVPVRFVAYGDMGISPAPGAVATAERVLEELGSLDLALHIGDISYALGRGIVWEAFGNLIEPIATHIPYQVSVGNHEYCHTSGGEKDPSKAPGTGFHPSWGNYGDDSLGECGVPTYHRFHMPDNGNSLFWYSFDYGSVHFLQFSAEHDFLPGSDQYRWMASDLASVDRTLTPWIVVSSHRPAYCSENYESDYNVSLYIRQALEPLLTQFQVNFYLSGHYHSAEFVCPVLNGTCLGDFTHPFGTIHLMIGMSGASLDNADYMSVPWSVYHDQAFGVAFFTVYNSSVLNFEYRHNDDNKVYFTQDIGNWAFV